MPKADASTSLRQKLYEARHLIPVVLLIGSVILSIYTGFATATEAAAIGVVGALVVSASQKALTWDSFKASLFGATRLYCMIALILAGAAFMTLSMGYIGLPRQLAEYVGSLNLSPAMLIVVLGLFYILIGCFLDGISTIVLTMSVVLPIIQAAGIDPLWFGIFLVITVETAQITPPVGFNLFVLQSMTGKQITYIAKVCAPYFLLMLLALVMLWYFPQIVTALPSKCEPDQLACVPLSAAGDPLEHPPALPQSARRLTPDRGSCCGSCGQIQLSWRTLIPSMTKAAP